MGQKIFIIENHFIPFANKMFPHDGAAYSCSSTGFQVARVFFDFVLSPQRRFCNGHKKVIKLIHATLIFSDRLSIKWLPPLGLEGLMEDYR